MSGAADKGPEPRAEQRRVLALVAHGQPSDPLPAARELEALALAVSQHLPGWQVAAATLSEPGALARLAALPPGLVFPVFIASGWFTQKALPARMAEAGLEGWQIMTPMGEETEILDLAVALAQESGAPEILLAGHGSGRSPVPSQICRHLAARISESLGLRCEAAFIEEAPRLSEVSGWSDQAVCLPFFAMSGGHVTGDLPEALAGAGFAGRILPALGLDARIPALIAGFARRS